MMLEAIERKPKKLFGKKKQAAAEIFPHPVLSSTESAVVPEPLDLFAQALNTEIFKQDQQITAVLRGNSDNIVNFTGPRILDWNKSTGRVALAESVIRNSESEFLAFRQRMQAMADADGCGGINERSIKSNSFGGNNILEFKSVSQMLNPTAARHQSGEHSHCSSCNADLKDGICPNGHSSGAAA